MEERSSALHAVCVWCCQVISMDISGAIGVLCLGTPLLVFHFISYLPSNLPWLNWGGVTRRRPHWKSSIQEGNWSDSPFTIYLLPCSLLNGLNIYKITLYPILLGVVERCFYWLIKTINPSYWSFPELLPKPERVLDWFLWLQLPTSPSASISSSLFFGITAQCASATIFLFFSLHISQIMRQPHDIFMFCSGWDPLFIVHNSKRSSSGLAFSVCAFVDAHFYGK